MKLPIKASGSAVARKLRITRGKKKIFGRNKTGIHSSPRLFSQRIDLPFFSPPPSLSFHSPSSFSSVSEEKSLRIFGLRPVFLGSRACMWLIQTYQFNNSQHDFARGRKIFIILPISGVPAACSSRHRGQSWPCR